MGKFIDLTGKHFGKLTVTKQAPSYRAPNGKTVIMWECQCDCGSTTIIRAASLTNGLTLSCGCYKKETASTRIKEISSKYNKYDLSGQYGIGYTSNTNEPFLFDLEDYELIKDHCWMKKSDGYLVTRCHNEDHSDTKLYRMHRLIMNPDDNVLIDHVNHNKMDNRKENLRPCNSFQNNCNKNTSRNNKSGHNGVYFRSNRNKWAARIGVNNKIISLGCFETKEEAINARVEAETKYYKDFKNYNGGIV